jgi:hypothetical protein
MVQGYKPVSIKDVTYDKLTEICRKIGMSKTTLLSTLITEIFILTATTDGFNMEFATNPLDDTLTIILKDRKYQATEAKMDAKVLKEESRAKPILKAKFKDTKGFVEVKPK